MTDSSSSDKNTPDNTLKSTEPPIKKDAKAKPTVSPRKPDRTSARTPVASPKQPISKTAIVSLLLSLATIAGVAALFYWHQQHASEQQTSINTKIQQNNDQFGQQVTQLLRQQQVNFQQQLTSALAETTAQNEARIAQLNAQISRLEQSSPEDWLLHEADYLIRIASRTIWFERDTKAAINLLKDADERLKALDSAKFLSIRQLIRADIEALKLVPELTTEEATLTLMALDEQIAQLPLAMADIPESIDNEEDLTLSNNTADWRENLAKTWQRFKQDFITIRRRNGQVEPLMSPAHQQNLKENLSLTLQQAQWAASKENNALYLASLDKAQAWLLTYFDTNEQKTIKFNQALQSLKNETIEFQLPSNLQSLEAIKQHMSESELETLPQQQTPINSPVQQEVQQSDISAQNGDVI
ncbi:uroporphyrinogen-III C-methyltransferase [Thalassotalea sp. 1_MG-2023]|uniref:uroporphyrinogen-III C-methyltransferase n=1 Tax=Thalassotalea sp. 1_MG-2023 TaxID=3062680 RepID=UPI0026E3BF89|nr:uroporphyrinogen-III C-methyltransferase [Thalassotalea sp. 1_MG-2023]MDO6425951.1 uroporphyrinogen-III C-methyltransferase [Thalassotalea sp. 1_MG-2023]